MSKKCFQIFMPILTLALFTSNVWAATSTSIAQYPLFLTNGVPPIVMLTMGRDHKLYYEAYNDASDLNDDGQLDIGYKPTIDYFGYFDSNKCYSYSSNLFSPVSKANNKQCSASAGRWSGDFLNYVTTSRMDALRKVLYGGFRSTDTTTQTVLKRAFIPQDAHSWGKEYTSTAVDGYDISHYAPLNQPAIGTRHLFANVSLNYGAQPLMRVLNDSTYRIWEWVSIERPVAGNKCLRGDGPECYRAESTSGVTVPSTVLTNVIRSTYDISDTGNNHPNSHSEFNTWETNYAIPSKLFGSGPMSTIESNNNPYGGADNNYLTIVTATLNIPTSGNYEFTVDGDDAVEVIIDDIYVAGYYGGHGFCNCNSHSTGVISLAAGTHTIKFRHEQRGGDAGFVLRWVKTLPESKIVDYSVNVEVCKAGLEEGDNCRAYSDGTTTTYKPTGILQRYGEDDLMAFGLLTGSYTNNTAGGVIRKNIASFKDEVDLNTGRFTSMSGIVDTINKLRIQSFNYGDHSYSSGWIANRAMVNGEAQEWGNPIAEMMYEGLRYFAGKASPTPAYNSGVSTGTDTTVLKLPLPKWLDPYRTTEGGYAHCAKPLQLVISDINTSFDSDQLPGSYFSSFTGDLTGMDVSALAKTIWDGESEASNIFIGQSGTDYDGTPSPKTVNTFANIRGLAPEEPTRQGSYYAGSVALYGKKTDLHPIKGEQNVDTISVVLASPLPRIEIPVAETIVTLVPFAKSVGGSVSGQNISSAKGAFQPTNQIVDFYIETIVNTHAKNMDLTVNGGRPYGLFRINYEDVEQAADHDMDAIVEYIFTVNSNNELKVELNSTYAAGSITQHMGYVISGTTADGTYLEVRDIPSGGEVSVDYFLDTPPGRLPGEILGNGEPAWKDNKPLPFASSRTFTVGTTASASFIKHDPLWYAAKWSMIDKNGMLEKSEWDSDGDGVPDGYFLVTNAGKLETQLDKAFAEIIARTSSSAAVATNSTRLDTNTKIYQARFNSYDWSGQLLAFDLDDTNGSIGGRVWNAADLIPIENSRNIFSYDPLATGSKGIAFEYANLNPTQQANLDKNALGTDDSLGADRVAYIRGDRNNEISSGPFRARTSILGDIVNSDPWFVGQSDNLGYSVLAGSEGTDYPAYLTSKTSKTAMLYFGANDGMLHAIDANEGIEKFAYIPESLIPKLNILTSPLYGCSGASCLPHEYFVDGAPKAGDAYIDSAWQSILVGTLGGGGKGLFALNITNPTSFSTNDVMWEISTTQSPKAADLVHFQDNLGYTLPQASVVKMHDGSWAAIVANGYESTLKKAVLFIIDIKSGEIIKMIDTGIGGSNGLSTPIAVDENGDSIVDSIYAGDLLGNLWKFDVSSSSSSDWSSAFTNEDATPAPLYAAKDGDGNVQAITAKPQVGKHPDGGLMVYFGTGKYFEVGDQLVGNSPQINSFYAIRDQNAVVSSRTNLQKQSILYETTIAALAIDLRVTSDTQVDYQINNGWYMDLESPITQPQGEPPIYRAEGERVVSAPLLRGGRIIFTTLIPESDPCGWGGSSWLMELDAVNGRRLDTSPFDINNDGVFDLDDLVQSYDTNNDGKIDADDHVEVSGIRKHDVGIIKTPGVVTMGDGKEMKYVSGSSGNLDNISESSGDPVGRQSWRQLR